MQLAFRSYRQGLRLSAWLLALSLHCFANPVAAQSGRLSDRPALSSGLGIEAQPVRGIPSSSGFDEFLPVDEAFSLGAWPQEGGVQLVWQIANDYYLYHHRLEFDASSLVGGTLSPGQLPAAVPEEDEYFGKVEVYYRELAVQLLPGTAPLETLSGVLRIQYQGCAKAGLCYPPQQRYLHLRSGEVYLSNSRSPP